MTINKSVLSKLETEKYAKCICKKDIEVETVLIGFPGMGLAGAIAAQHISEELELETIGFVEGLAIPPVAVFLDGLLRHPYRIMGKEGLKTAVFIGESAVKSEVSYYISNAVMDWCDNHGAKNVIVLDGFAYMKKEDELKVYMVAEPEIKEKMEKMDIPPLKSGYIGGFAGAILNRTMINEIDGYALLVGTRPNIPDPGGAAKLITKVNDIEDLDIDIKELNKQSESIKKKLQELADQQRKISQQSGEKEGAPSTYYT